MEANSALEGERKQVTVLFAGVKNSVTGIVYDVDGKFQKSLEAAVPSTRPSRVSSDCLRLWLEEVLPAHARLLVQALDRAERT